MQNAISVPRWALFVLLLGAYLTIRGYHSRDGDQAYRLPLLLHAQNQNLFADDPFVKAFDTFNPHKGYLALLSFASRPFGLSFGLFALFVTTFGLLCYGIDRLSRSLWPQAGPIVGFLAVVLALLAKAGNVGTNHLFEAMLLDRLVGFSLGWVALALAIEGKNFVPAFLIGIATFVHPSVGLQLGALLSVSWITWALAAKWTGVSIRSSAAGLALICIAVIPGAAMTMGQGKQLFVGLSPEDYRHLGVNLQMAQHMVPSLWRETQWLAWAGYIVLGIVAIIAECRLPQANDIKPLTIKMRRRFAISFGLLLAGLGIAYLAVEVLGDLRITVFQPFRMATIARGMALLAVSGRFVMVVHRGESLAWVRLLVFASGLAGDRGFLVAALFEMVATLADRYRWPKALPLIGLAIGVVDLVRHDTESGHIGLMVALCGGFALTAIQQRGIRLGWTKLRCAGVIVACWSIPIAAFLAPMIFKSDSKIVDSLAGRCRFAAVPTDDIEKLAVWSKQNTEPNARFITPPGPKTFRLWSERAVAFNRAASPYHAAGLKDWYERFRAHVAFQGSTEEFVQGYFGDRHGFESRFAKLDENGLAALAEGQGATYVLAAKGIKAEGRLKLVRDQGRYAIYRVQPIEVAVAPLAGAIVK